MDNKFTEQLTDWLNTPKEKRDIALGATMLLRLNNNRFLYANIMRRPEKFADKLEYELRKHLNIRLDGLTRRDVAQLESKIIPQAKQTLANAPAVITTDDEKPKAKVAKGRRADHETLPPQIQALWDNNLQLYKTIKNVFEQLKTMEKAQPCDRYEYLKILEDADRRYRANLERYDNYVPGSEPPAVETAEDNTDPDTAALRKINAARKTLTKYKKILANSADDKERAATAREKIIACVATIRENGGSIGTAVTADLQKLGILINDNA